MLADSKVERRRGQPRTHARIVEYSSPAAYVCRPQTQKGPNRLAETRTASLLAVAVLRIRKPWVFFPPWIPMSSLVAGRKQAPGCRLGLFWPRRPAGPGVGARRTRGASIADRAMTARDRVARRFPVSRGARLPCPPARCRASHVPRVAFPDRSSIGICWDSLADRFSGFCFVCALVVVVALDVWCSVGPARDRREWAMLARFSTARARRDCICMSHGPGVASHGTVQPQLSHRGLGSPRSSLRPGECPYPLGFGRAARGHGRMARRCGRGRAWYLFSANLTHLDPPVSKQAHGCR